MYFQEVAKSDQCIMHIANFSESNKQIPPSPLLRESAPQALYSKEWRSWTFHYSRCDRTSSGGPPWSGLPSLLPPLILLRRMVLLGLSNLKYVEVDSLYSYYKKERSMNQCRVYTISCELEMPPANVYSFTQHVLQ